MSIYLNSISVGRPNFLGGGQWEVAGLNHITVVFGKNGSGKSLLLRYWRDKNIEKTHYVVPERVGSLTFEPAFAAEQLNASSRKNQSDANFSGSYRQHIISRIQGYFVTRGASKLSQLPGNPGELEAFLSLLIPDFSVSLIGKTPPYELRRLTDNKLVDGVNNLSSGESQLLTIALDILTIAAIWEMDQTDQRLILIDEPDAHLHPDLQVRFAEFVVRVKNRFNLQIVISSHSTTLLSAIGQFAGSESSVVYLLRSQAQYIAQVFNDTLKELSACLGGHVLMGPLFGAPILIVEGDDDFKIWSQVPRHGVVNIAVIPSNGDEIKRYQKTLEAMLNALCEPKNMGHALLDGDKGLPLPNEKNKQQYIKFIKLNCHEAENLFLTDEVLSDLGLNWEQSIQRVKQESGKFGEKANELIGITGQDRRNSDLKRVINELSVILDTKNVHWTTRVGNRLGRSRPIGQLADYLGEQVVNSIWPALLIQGMVVLAVYLIP